MIDPSTIVIATHQFGIPCDIERICEICAQHGAVVIEDVAAAFGTRIRGRLAGTFAHASFFSFDSTKLINVPLKGGFVATNNRDVFNRASRVARDTFRPMSPLRKLSLLAQAFALLAIENQTLYRLFHKVVFEWRGRFTADGPELGRQMTDYYLDAMSEWQAFLANEQLRDLDGIIRHRQEVYASFWEALKDCTEIEVPPPDRHREWACIRFPIRVRENKMDFYRKATQQGVDFAFSFTYIAAPEAMRKSHSIARAILNLPFYTNLTPQEMVQVTKVLRRLAA